MLNETVFEKIVDDFAENGFCILNNFVPKDVYLTLRQELIEAYEQEEFKKAAIGQNSSEIINQSIRGDEIVWLENNDHREGVNAYYQCIQDLQNYLNRYCFAGIQDSEFHFAVYPPGTFYQKHLDVFKQDDARLFSVVFYLNENWEPSQGGELVIYTDKKNIVIPPIGNQLVFFDSSKFYHEVLKTNVPRYSVTGWLKRAKLF
jgi:SM-20-related protein